MNLYNIRVYISLFILSVALATVVNADLTCSSSFVMKNDSSIDQIVAKV